MISKQFSRSLHRRNESLEKSKVIEVICTSNSIVSFVLLQQSLSLAILNSLLFPSTSSSQHHVWKFLIILIRVFASNSGSIQVSCQRHLFELLKLKGWRLFMEISNHFLEWSSGAEQTLQWTAIPCLWAIKISTLILQQCVSFPCNSFCLLIRSFNSAMSVTKRLSQK